MSREVSKPTSVRYTPLQLSNLAAYGFCWECRAPREVRIWETEKDGHKTSHMGIVCPNGHPQ